jgi:hypothetical protein
MAKYAGISKKKMKDGSIAIMARFKHDGVTYPIKNFTKLYGIKTEKEGFLKLNEVKNLLSEGKNPFSSSLGSMDALFNKKIEINKKNNVWAEYTIKNYQYIYFKHISPKIGKKKIQKVKYEDILNILNSFKHEQSNSKNKIIDVLRPLFKEEYNKGNLLENLMNKIDKYDHRAKREDLSKRTDFKHSEIVRKLYEAIPLYNQAHHSNIEQHRIFLYMILLTAHRYGELNKLEKKHCNIDKKKIIAPASITKTKEDYHYPIPDEVLEYIKNHKGGRLFNIPRGGQSGRIFHRLLIKAGITTIDNHSISMHDTRKLMMSIMISKLGIDSRLADYCLEHKQQGTIKHYLEFTYEDKVDAYNKYWNFIRTGKVEATKNINKNAEALNENSQDKLDKIERISELYTKGLITEEEFTLLKKEIL